MRRAAVDEATKLTWTLNKGRGRGCKLKRTETTSGSTETKRFYAINDYHMVTYSAPRTYIILKFSTQCILAVNFFFLFQTNANNVLNTYIYLLLPPTCSSVPLTQ
jgi:hypothetical protein